jgi:hypothetical protein
MDADVTYGLAMSCALPALVGFWRYNKIPRAFHLFIYMMVLTMLIETIVYVNNKFPQHGSYWPLAVNIYTLLNFWVFLYFIRMSGYLAKKTMQWLFVAAIAVAVFNFIYEQNSVFKIFFYLLCYVSAIMLIICIDILSRQTTAIKYKLINNFWFWFSSFSIVYNSFTLLIFGLYFFAMFNTPKGKAIGTIHHFANMICYVFFTVAILKIPKKK